MLCCLENKTSRSKAYFWIPVETSGRPVCVFTIKVRCVYICTVSNHQTGW